MEIRFASIPKCASRSLKKLGLLGELEGRCHTRIHDYPDWQKYHWMAVDRPAADWYESWWLECKSLNNLFAIKFGMKFQDMGADLNLLKTVPEITSAELRPFVNQWVQPDFSQRYPDYLEKGLGLKEICFDTITCGVTCEILRMQDLDVWLLSQGIRPVHLNERVVNA